MQIRQTMKKLETSSLKTFEINVTQCEIGYSSSSLCKTGLLGFSNEVHHKIDDQETTFNGVAKFGLTLVQNPQVKLAAMKQERSLLYDIK